jgi:putative transposase
MEIIRGRQYRLYPTPEQSDLLSCTVGVVRLVYNLALEQRSTWGARRYGGHRHSMGAKGLSGELSNLRKAFDWIGAVSQTAQNQALLDLDRAFKNFFEGRAGYPSPRKKFQNDAFRHVGREIKIRKLNAKWAEVFIPKIGWVRYRDTRPIDGTIRNATFSRGAGGIWEISVACKIEIADPVPQNACIGVDRGVAIPFAMSDGTMVHLPDTIALREKSIRRARKELSRRLRGSNRYHKTRRRLATLQARNARARKHTGHVASTHLVKNFGMVAIEDLKITSMTKSAKGGVEAPGRNVRQKSGLNRVILNVGWYAFENMLSYKLSAAGGTLIKVSPHHTSQICSSCGERDPDNRKSQALFVCGGCGATHNADTNAAINILGRALAPPG